MFSAGDIITIEDVVHMVNLRVTKLILFLRIDDDLSQLLVIITVQKHVGS